MFILDEIIKKNFSKFESYTLLSINNKENFINLVLSNGDIVTSQNILFTYLEEIK